MNTQIPERISLGKSELRISPLGIGTNAWGFNRKGDPEKQPVFDAAREAGINFIDTAEIYNLGGSELTVGMALQKPHADVIIATKFFPYPWRFIKSSLTAALRASLKRLGLPKVDLYILHFPVPPVPLATWVEGLADVYEAGLTRAVGISNCNAAQTSWAYDILKRRGIPLASNQVEFSLLKRTAERNELLETCKELGVTLVGYRPLGYGILTGKYKLEDLPARLHGRTVTPDNLRRATPLIELLREFAHKYEKTPSQVALNWIMCKGVVPIPGAKNPRQAAENAGAMGWRLDAAEVEALDKASDPLS
jgi:aryl-alcohol dehydrogenase-like predicted oxidoreductase